jgi:carbonic anhydrase
MVLSLKLALLAVLAIPFVALAEGPAAPTADQALADLKAGNARFVAGKPQHPHQGLKRVKEVAASQHPEAIILGCADSRVPPEALFDKGIGDIFVVRVAGNVSEPATTGSVEYAAEHLHVPLVVVLGHHKCGAVKATVEATGPVEGNIGAIVKEIQPAVEAAKKSPGKEGLVDDAVHENTKLVAEELESESELLKNLVHEGKVKIVTAVYDLDSGKIEWGK